MVAGTGVIVMDGKTDIVGLVGRHAHITNLVRDQLALHLYNPLATLVTGRELAPLATVHDTVCQDIAILHLTLATLVADQVHEVSGLQFCLDLIICLALVPAAQRLTATAAHLDLGA